MVCLQRGNHFAETSTRARQTIAELGARFIRPGFVVLIHGYSRVVLALLRRAVSQVLPTPQLCSMVPVAALRRMPHSNNAHDLHVIMLHQARHM